MDKRSRFDDLLLLISDGSNSESKQSQTKSGSQQTPPPSDEKPPVGDSQDTSGDKKTDSSKNGQSDQKTPEGHGSTETFSVKDQNIPGLQGNSSTKDASFSDEKKEKQDEKDPIQYSNEPPAETTTTTPDPVPKAADDTATIDEDTSVTIDVLANDENTDGATLSIITNPEHGTATVQADLTILYTPNANYNGTDSFTYSLGESTATVNLTINPVNDPPVAFVDEIIMQEGEIIEITSDFLVDNDIDVDGDPLTAVLEELETETGVVFQRGEKTYYQPYPNTISETLTYTVSDGNGGTDEGEINITVLQAAAQNDTATLDEDDSITIDVRENDDNADFASLGIAQNPTYGMVTLNGDKTFTYTPNENYHGTDSFTYSLGNSTAIVSLTIDPVNDDPVAVVDEIIMQEGEEIEITSDFLVNNDIDVDGDLLTATMLPSDTKSGTVSVRDGRFYYQPKEETTSDTLVYTVSDENGGTNDGIINVTVNRPPVAVDDDVTIYKGESILFSDLLYYDTDPDGDQITVTSHSTPSHGMIDAGITTYTPHTGFTGRDSFTYTISDGRGGSDTATVMATVLPTDILSWDKDCLVFSLDDTAEDQTLEVSGNALLRTLSDSGDMHIDVTVTYDSATDQFTIEALDRNTGNLLGVETLARGTHNTNDKFSDLLNDEDNKLEICIEGGTGHDTLKSTTAIEHFIGGGGNDTVDHAGSGKKVVIDLSNNSHTGGTAGGDSTNGVVHVVGSKKSDEITGDDGDNTLHGGGGRDTLHGGTGADTLHGGGGRDTLHGGTGADTLHGGNGADNLKGGNGADILNGGNGHDTLNGGRGNDALYGNSGNDTLNGNRGNDYLYGLGGKDTLNGGKGNDTLTGGGGKDTFAFTLNSDSKEEDKITDFSLSSPREAIDLSDVSFNITKSTFSTYVDISKNGNDIKINIDRNLNGDRDLTITVQDRWNLHDSSGGNNPIKFILDDGNYLVYDM